MNTKLIFLGYGGYKIITPDNKHIVIDPYLTGNPVAPIDPGDFRAGRSFVDHPQRL